MKYTAGKTHTTRARRSNLATTLSNSKHVMTQAVLDMGGNSLSFKTAGPDPAGTTSGETVPSCMDSVMAVHTVTMAKEDMSGTVVKRDSAATDDQLQPPSKSKTKSLFDKRRNN